MRRFAFLPVFFVLISWNADASVNAVRHLYTKTVADTIPAKKDSTEQEDFGDVFRRLFKKGPAKKQDSITSKPSISVIPAAGYSLNTKLAVTITGNIAFRLSPDAKVSAITTSMGYTQNAQFTVPVISNIWTKHNAFNLVGDFRYYKYPQSTFGLGSNSNIHEEDPMRYKLLRFYEKIYKQISGDFYAGIGYDFDYRWEITHEGPLNGAPSDYQAYGPQDHSTVSGLTFNALFDSRDNSINSVRGFYASLQYRDNYKWLGSTNPYRSVILDIRKYIRVSDNSPNVLAFWSYNWLVLSGRPSYLELPATGWDAYSTTGRGYIQGRFRGAQMVYLESEYRFRIMHNGLLGGTVFANAETFSAEPGTALQRIQPAVGVGLRCKLNKLSKTNVAIDYGFGRQGSNGLFVGIGEVF